MEQIEKKLFHKKTVKNSLVLGYFSLLTKKTFSDITISELVKEANVSRVSFYRNFSSLDNVVDYGLTCFYETIAKDVLPVFINDRLTAWKNLINKFFSNVKLYDDVLFRIPHQNIEYLSNKLSKMLDLTKKSNETTIERKYLPVVNVSAVFSIAKVWVETGCTESVDDISNFTYKIISGNLSERK